MLLYVAVVLFMLQFVMILVRLYCVVKSVCLSSVHSDYF